MGFWCDVIRNSFSLTKKILGAFYLVWYILVSLIITIYHCCNRCYDRRSFQLAVGLFLGFNVSHLLKLYYQTTLRSQYFQSFPVNCVTHEGEKMRMKISTAASFNIFEHDIQLLPWTCELFC